ncbi:DUF3291 domain-containing protein [Klenkia sp. PcliD-1-E]|uniref:DUF3291 domain-containing protein n=1 Tax=Klenkia sp. PcliD-1-E TaxID=2954492 RepID=UPI0035AB772E
MALPVDPLTSARLAGPVDLLEPVDAAGDAAPGFVRRLQTEDGDATAVRGPGDDALIVDMSTWTSPETVGDDRGSGGTTSVHPPPPTSVAEDAHSSSHLIHAGQRRPSTWSSAPASHSCAPSPGASRCRAAT